LYLLDAAPPYFQICKADKLEINLAEYSLAPGGFIAAFYLKTQTFIQVGCRGNHHFCGGTFSLWNDHVLYLALCGKSSGIACKRIESGVY
jgi:hypothetical protein